MTRSRLGLAAALLLVATPGCDLVSSSLLDSVSSSDRSDLETLTGDFFDCDAEVRSLTDSASGSLDDGDCLQSDGSYQDFYAFRLSEVATLDIEMESDDLAPYLFLLSADLDSADPLREIARDRNTNRTGRAGVSVALPAGLYLVYANSVDVDETGNYTLTLDAEPSEARPASRAAVNVSGTK